MPFVSLLRLLNNFIISCLMTAFPLECVPPKGKNTPGAQELSGIPINLMVGRLSKESSSLANYF